MLDVLSSQESRERSSVRREPLSSKVLNMNAEKAHLLVVDDNELNRDMLSRRLERKGYTVDVAEDGYKALEQVGQTTYDLILLDIMMPGISGIDVLEELRKTYTIMQLPIIMATAKTDGATIVQTLQLGANDYVTKPLQFAEVLARVETQLSIRAQSQKNQNQTRTSGSFHKLENNDTPDVRDTKIFCGNCRTALIHDEPTCHTCSSMRPAEGWPRRSATLYPYLGTTIGERFFLEQFIDKGTTGSVYAARDLDLKRIFAAKIISLDGEGMGLSPDEVKQRTRLEVEAMVSLQNPHVVKIYEVTQIDDTTFALVMDFVKGLSLGSILKRLGNLKPSLALNLTRQVAQGLYEAHQLNMIHCDVKPDNIMLEKLPAGGYFAQILDFGIVHILDQPMNAEGFYGTPLYSAPERIREDMKIDHRSDIYSIGAMLYHMLTGRPPYIDDNIYKVFNHHIHTPPPEIHGLLNDPELEAHLNALIQRTMAKNPDDRFDNLLEVIKQIDAIQT
jgi:CheY-like chemotaxis protein